MLSLDGIQGEINNWKTKWQQHLETHGKASLPASPAQHASCMFVNICSLLEILCTLPVTSCSSERSHSSLKLIKTSICSTMANERLSGLALQYIHRNIPIDIPDVIEEVSRRHPHKLRLLKNKLLDQFLTIMFLTYLYCICKNKEYNQNNLHFEMQCVTPIGTT